MQFLAKLLKGIVFVLSCLVFLISVGCLNSEGTTWGNSMAFVGFLLIIPSFIGMLKVRLGNFSKWFNFFIGLAAILYTTFSYLEAQKKIKDFAFSEKIYWAPESSLQLIAAILSLFLILPILVIFMKNEKSQQTVQ